MVVQLLAGSRVGKGLQLFNSFAEPSFKRTTPRMAFPFLALAAIDQNFDQRIGKRGEAAAFIIYC